MEAFFMEKATVKSAIDPVDLNDGANTGARIDMSKCRRVTFVLFAKAGTAPSSHTVSFQQHDAASAGNSVALSIDSPYFHKLDAATYFTKVQPSAAASSFDIDALVIDAKFVAVFEVLAEQLTDGYKWASMNVTDAGGAQLGACLAICHDMKDLPSYSVVV